MTKNDTPYLLPDKLDYVTARLLAASPDVAIRKTLGASARVSPEILFFLAADPDPEVRATVAANPACPVKTNLLLAEDKEHSVRVAVAAKAENADFRQSATGQKVIERLVMDQVTQVRLVIAEALKDVADADPAVINRLARDAEIIVAAPILEFSPVLTDQDLLEIIASDPVPGALSAIARRRYVDSVVTSAIVASNDSVAITHMLKNGSAQLQENVLNSLIERSVNEPTWQEPLVYRPELKQRSAIRLAELVAVHLLDRILERKDLSPETVKAVAQVVGQRLKEQEANQAQGPGNELVEQRYASRLERAQQDYAKGGLDELTLMVMLLVDSEDDMVVVLAARSGLPIKTVLDIVETQAPRAMCALAWAAGLSAKFAAELQVRLAKLPYDKILKPTASGRYAMTDEELRWQLAIFTANKA